MNYNDEIKYSHSEEYADDTSRIIDRIIEYFPEYTSHSAEVTEEFIRVVNACDDDDFDPEDVDLETLSDEEVREVISRVPKDLLSKPIDPLTIKTITDSLFSTIHNRVLNTLASSDCDDADSFEGRGSVLKELGLFDDSLSDFNKACELEPDNPDCLMDRADLLVSMGKKAEALQDAIRAFYLLGTDSVTDLIDSLPLSFIFQDCGNDEMTIKCLIKHVESFKSLLPFMSIQKSGAFSVEKDGEDYSSDIATFEIIFKMISDIEAANNTIPIMNLLESLKKEIVICRTLGGF
jgi:tetratricopeptide (TPR) repeat protein